MVDTPAKTCPNLTWKKRAMTVERENNKMGEVLPKTKTCIKCGETKPANQFKRRLSLAQSRAVLRNPNITTNYIADSKLCKACQPKRKPPRELTTKEIRTRMSNGDMNSTMGEMKLQQIRQTIPQVRSRVMKEYWEKIKSQPYKTLKRNLQDQLNRYGNRHFASRNLQDATREQNSWNYEQAKIIMKQLLTEAQNGVDIPPLIQIATLIKPKGEAQWNG